VQGDDPAVILGKLESNGRVFLVSPSGIYFGPDSQVHVGALIASTLDLGGEDFLQGRYHFERKSQGKILNEGSLQAEDGIALISSNIENRGIIHAIKGSVILADKEWVTLDFTGDGKILFALDEKDSFPAQDIELTRAIQSVISTDGIVVANQLIQKDGGIFLSQGKIVASQGSVHLEGNDIFLQEGSIDTSSCYGGGDVGIFAAHKVDVSPSFTIKADALEEGCGGSVIIWSDETTMYNGQIFSRGGADGGNGGAVETSGKKSLEVREGIVDTSAPFGDRGTWLLDPYSIVIAEGGGGASLSELKDCYDEISSYVIAPSVIENSASHVHLCTMTEEGSITLARPLRMKNEGIGLIFSVHEESGRIEILSDISTKGGQIRCEGAVFLGDDGSRILDTTFAGVEKGGSIFFEGTVDGKVDLQLITGNKGTVQCSQTVGGIAPLSSFTMGKGAKLSLAQDVITAAGNIHISVPMTLKGHTKLDTTGRGAHPEGADILLASSVNGNYKFSLDSGKRGAIIIDGSEGIGSKVELAVMQMKGSSIQLGNDIAASGGTIIFDGPLVVGANLTLTDTGPTGIIFLGTVNASSSGKSLTLNAPVGKVAFASLVGNTTPMQNMTISANAIQIGNNITVTSGLTVTGATQLTGSSTIAAPTIHFLGPIDGSYDLSFNAGASGSIALDNQIGTSVRLGTVSFTQANTITANGIFADAIVQGASNASTFNGVLNTIGPNGISLTGVAFTFDGDIQTGGGGDILINNSGTVTATTSVDVTTSGNFVQSGAGAVRWMGTITAQNQDIEFAGPVQLLGSLSLSTGNAGAGDITFQNTVDGAYPLTFALGAGDLSLEAALGAITALGDVTIYSARNVTAEDIYATGITEVGAIGSSNFLGHMKATSLVGIHLVSTYLNFAGQLGGKRLQVTQGDIVLNSWYSSINTSANPVVVDIFKGTSSNEGTLFVGTANVGYFVCDASIQDHCPVFLGSVRANVPCYVEYNGIKFTPQDCPTPLID
jgi:hypothetical protein